MSESASRRSQASDGGHDLVDVTKVDERYISSGTTKFLDSGASCRDSDDRHARRLACLDISRSVTDEHSPIGSGLLNSDADKLLAALTILG